MKKILFLTLFDSYANLKLTWPWVLLLFERVDVLPQCLHPEVVHVGIRIRMTGMPWTGPTLGRLGRTGHELGWQSSAQSLSVTGQTH